MSQPGEKFKFNQVSTHSSSVKNTFREIVNDSEDMILFRRKDRVTINDRQSRRCRSTTIMSIPSRRLINQVTSLDNSFFYLRLVKFFHRACTELLTGGLAHPKMIKEYFFPFETGHRLGMRKRLRITVPGECKRETASHDVGHNDVTWSVRIYRSTPIKKCHANFWRVHNNYWFGQLR